MKKPFITVIIAVLALAGIILYQLIVFNDNKLHIVMCDIGQGDAIYIRSPSGLDFLVDGGPDKKVVSCLNRHMPLWDRTLDAIVLTNADLDHYGGFLEVIKSYHVKQFVTTNIGKNDKGFEMLEELVEKNGVPVQIMSSNDILRDRKVVIKALWPIGESVYSSTLPSQEGKAVLGAKAAPLVNEYSLVLKLTYLEFDMLLTGDIVPPSTDEVARSLRSGQADIEVVEVLKVPHHGSKNGLTEALLTATQPKTALISAGKNNRFGHPHKEILGLLEKFQIKTYRTDHLGDIEVVSDGKNWSVR